MWTLSICVFVSVWTALCLGNDRVPDFDPYQVLGVPRSASQSEIRKAYRTLALEYHPDKNQDENSADIFSTINAAYDILGNPDKRAVFDDFGRSSSGHTGFYSYWEWQQSNTQSDNDFYIGDPYITRLTAQLWEERIQGAPPSVLQSDISGNHIWLVNFYAPWCHHCQQAVQKYKSVAGRLDGVVEVGAFNCHKDQDFCRDFGIREYPSFYLISPELEFQQLMPLTNADIEEQIFEFATLRGQEWKRLGFQSALILLDSSNFDEKLKNSEEFWIVVFIGGSVSSKSKSYSARANIVRLSANLRGLANTAIMDCNAEWELCQREFPDRVLNTGSFPLFRGYARGTRKMSEELFVYDTTPVHVACEIIEKMVQLLMANERICKDGVCHAVAQAFEEGYEEYVEEQPEEPRQQRYQDSGAQKPKYLTIEGGRPVNMLGRG